MRNTFMNTLADIATEDPKVWLLCGDLGFSVLEPFAAAFPDRYINVGVAEQNMAGIAAGLALSGKTVFIYSIANFPTLRCLEQIRNDICYHGADVKIVSVGGGYAYGSQGYTHHALEDVAIMSMLPGIEVFVPCDPAEARAATRLIAASRRPSYLRLSRSGEPVLGDTEPLDLRRARVLRDGSDVVVLASGPIVGACLEAAEALEADGRRVGVVSVPCMKPIDEAFVRDVARQARLIVTVEEHVLRGGLHWSVAAITAAESRRSPILGLGVPEPANKISRAGSREALLAADGLSPGLIRARIEERLRAMSRTPV